MRPAVRRRLSRRLHDAIRCCRRLLGGCVALREGDRGEFAVWMRRAAMEGDTFYGALPVVRLDRGVRLPGGTIGNADVEALSAAPRGRRAFALLQVGEKRLAEAELRTLWLDTARDGAFDRPLALVAGAVGFTQLEAEIERNDLRRPDGAAFVKLRPASGFLIEPPLVYALVHHESNFHAAAVSNSGARGLMQIMPSTAYAVAGGQASRLQDPEVNLAIGQKLVLALAEDDAIDGDLIRLLAGYGQGQNGLRKWVDNVRDDGDPLMFIEAIPNPGTRSYIRDALDVLVALRGGTAHAGVEPRRAGRRPLPTAGPRRPGRPARQRCLHPIGRGPAPLPHRIETSRQATHIAARKEGWR